MHLYKLRDLSYFFHSSIAFHKLICLQCNVIPKWHILKDEERERKGEREEGRQGGRERNIPSIDLFLKWPQQQIPGQIKLRMFFWVLHMFCCCPRKVDQKQNSWDSSQRPMGCQCHSTNFICYATMPALPFNH